MLSTGLQHRLFDLSHSVLFADSGTPLGECLTAHDVHEGTKRGRSPAETLNPYAALDLPTVESFKVVEVGARIAEELIDSDKVVATVLIGLICPTPMIGSADFYALNKTLLLFGQLDG